MTRLLSFIIILKILNKNSIIHNQDTNLVMAKKCNMSVNTYKKYLGELKNRGIVKSSGNNLQIVSFNKACEILDIKMSRFVHCFNKCTYTKLSIKNVSKKIYEQTALLNFNQQKYRIDYKKKQFDFATKVENCRYTSKKATKALLQKYGTAKCAIKSVSKNYKDQIVTGKNHISKLLGVSSSKAQNILKAMVQDNLIKRTVVIEKTFIEVNNYSFDFLKSQKKQLYIPSRCGTYYYSPLGSVIVVC